MLIDVAEARRAVYGRQTSYRHHLSDDDPQVLPRLHTAHRHTTALGPAQRALDRGGPARAAGLLGAASFNDTTSAMAYYEVRAAGEGWTEGDWDQRFAAEVGKVFGNPDRSRRAQSVLAEEMARWEQLA
mgnify:CR=1 FL=1